jgi:hypothetical protein
MEMVRCIFRANGTYDKSGHLQQLYDTLEIVKLQVRLCADLKLIGTRQQSEPALLTESIGRSIAFIVDRPVKREIFAADFRDRVVHHLVINKLNDLFEKESKVHCRNGTNCPPINRCSTKTGRVFRLRTKS